MSLVLTEENKSHIDDTRALVAAKLELAIDDKNIVRGNAAEVWNDYLTAATGIEAVNVAQLSAYREMFGEVLAEKALPMMVAKAKENADVGHLTLRVDTPDVEFGIDFSRPVMIDGKKPTLELVQAGMACMYRVRTSERLAEIEQATAAQWDIE